MEKMRNFAFFQIVSNAFVGHMMSYENDHKNLLNKFWSFMHSKKLSSVVREKNGRPCEDFPKYCEFLTYASVGARQVRAQVWFLARDR